MTVGILGGGQLARMLALAGRPLGLRFAFLDPGAEPPVAGLGRVVRGAYDDPDALDRFTEGLDLVTWEFENVPASSAERLAARLPVFPPSIALDTARDRLTEKETFTALDIPIAPFHVVGSREELEEGVARLATPAVLKTRWLGYDGKGQFVLEDASDTDAAWAALGDRATHTSGRTPGGEPALVLEAFVDFARELSIVAVRGRSGETRFYPLVENVHESGILRRTLAPAPGRTEALQAQAEAYASRVLHALGYVGVLAIELFHAGDALIANEMAPRVHNSGHWTQDGAVCDQFENHLRAICGLPLGSTDARGHTEMLNFIGGVPPVEAVLAIPGTHLHLYDKAPRPGRKLGHVNVTGDDPLELRERASEVERIRVSP
jgi:5-(carboxyamino)imidazole ribonucleotide synthase